MDVPSWCRVGNKCVCVKRDGWRHSVTNRAATGRDLPVYGGVYTISAVEHGHDGMVYIRLAEFVGPVFVTRFLVSRFKPAVSLEDDIKTHFQALLDQPMREVV